MWRRWHSSSDAAPIVIVVVQVVVCDGSGSTCTSAALLPVVVFDADLLAGVIGIGSVRKHGGSCSLVTWLGCWV